MAECVCLANCAFFHDRMSVMPSTAAMIKRQYCAGPQASNVKCARFLVFRKMGQRGVPADLYPAQVYRVREITGDI